jgi:hypothetical protein
MAQTNDWSLYNLYPPNGGIGGIWTQPIAGGLVFPQQVTANSNLFTTEAFSELTGQFVFSCGHSGNMIYCVREYDYENEISVALLCCCLCGTVQRTISPFEAAVTGSSPSSLANQILYP